VLFPLSPLLFRIFRSTIVSSTFRRYSFPLCPAAVSDYVSSSPVVFSSGELFSRGLSLPFCLAFPSSRSAPLRVFLPAATFVELLSPRARIRFLRQPRHFRDCPSSISFYVSQHQHPSVSSSFPVAFLEVFVIIEECSSFLAWPHELVSLSYPPG